MSSTPLIWIFAALLSFASAGAPAAAQTAAQKCSQDYTAANATPALAANWSVAVTDCSQAIAQNPQDEAPFINRCQAYDGLGNYNAALADCNQALALNPHDDDAHTNRAIAYQGLGNNAAAIADFREALAINPSNQKAQAGLKKVGAG